MPSALPYYEPTSSTSSETLHQQLAATPTFVLTHPVDMPHVVANELARCNSLQHGGCHFGGSLVRCLNLSYFNPSQGEDRLPTGGRGEVGRCVCILYCKYVCV